MTLHQNQKQLLLQQSGAGEELLLSLLKVSFPTRFLENTFKVFIAQVQG